MGERHHALSSLYTTALVATGATPVLLPSVAAHHAEEVIARIDGLLITGGGDIDPARYGAENTASSDIDPVRDEWELALVGAARRHGLPLLGVCRGLQVLNVALGGSLHQHVWDSDDHHHLWSDDGTRLSSGHHDVVIDGRLAEIYGKDARRVNSLHHQSIDRLGAGMEVVATAPDGRVEAAATTGRWAALGVQWHPERLDLSDEMPLFRWLCEQSSR